MVQKILKQLLNISVEIVSFLILIPVLIVSVVVLVATGKFEAFSFQKKKEEDRLEGHGAWGMGHGERRLENEQLVLQSEIRPLRSLQ